MPGRPASIPISTTTEAEIAACEPWASILARQTVYDLRPDGGLMRLRLCGMKA